MLSFLFSQFGRPRGRLGKWIVRSMNRSHLPLTRYVLADMQTLQPKTALDIGCGGGATVAQLLSYYPDARVCGIDYAEVSVAVAREYNAAAIHQGRCEILQGNVLRLPYRDAVFDLITAIETVYFWPNPLKSFEEVARVLRPGGYFLIGCNTGNERVNHYVGKLMPEANLYKPEEIFYFAESAGLKLIECKANPESPIAIRIILQKPNPPTK